jgi:hypothetical protein
MISHLKRPLQTIEEVSNIKRSKPGPKPKPLLDYTSSYLAPIQRVQINRPRERKLAVLRYWKYALVEGQNGIMRHVTRDEVSARYKIPGSTLSGWLCQENIILNSESHSQQRRRPDKAMYPELERNLYELFVQKRTEGKCIRRVWFRLASKYLFTQIYPELDKQQFKFSEGWFSGFLSRWEISLRATTNKAQEIPENLRHIIINWFQFNCRNSQLRDGDYTYDIGRYDFAHIANMDQTPLPFEYLSGKTYACKGDKTIWVKVTRSGWDKQQATLVLTVFADGEL